MGFAQLLRREAEGYYEILAGTETIKVTAEHPFWRQGSGWADAKDLKPGDSIAAATDEVMVRRSKYIKGPASVYKFSVEVNHNYFVSSHKLWVHNAGNGPCDCEGGTCKITHDEDPAPGGVIETKFEGKILNQMDKRRWNKESVNETIAYPSRAVATRDTRWNPDGSRRDAPATA